MKYIKLLSARWKAYIKRMEESGNLVILKSNI